MEYKFEKLQVWQLSLELIDLVYDFAGFFPEDEKYNLKSQMTRAATSVSLNIAEGSTSSSNAEQVRFLKISLRSLIETIACRKIAERRRYVEDDDASQDLKLLQDSLFIKIQAFIKSLGR